jgi:hypothetical protein
VRHVVGLPIGLVGEDGGCHVQPELILLVRGVASVVLGTRTTVDSKRWQTLWFFPFDRYMAAGHDTHDFLCSSFRQAYITVTSES